jgi:predicted MFS family arabinose efflux permease
MKRRLSALSSSNLLPLTCAFAMSHAFRTTVTLTSGQLSADLALSDQEIGVIASAFHVAFGVSQLAMGVALDVSGPRRVVIWVFPLVIAGAGLSALASSLTLLIAGQLLVGIGCAPMFLAAASLIARGYPAEKFSRMSGLVLSGGSLGMLITGTPLAWVVSVYSWRAGYMVLAIMSAVIWLWLFAVLPRMDRNTFSSVSTRVAIMEMRSILVMRQTIGIAALAFVTYGSFIALRGLWLVPMLTERYRFSLIESGNVALVMSVLTICAPMLFGRIDPGGRARRWLMINFTIVYALIFAVLAAGYSAKIDICALLCAGLFAGYFILQYADVRDAYDTALIGRALATFNTAMFVGVAFDQGLSGLAAELASMRGINPTEGAFAAIAVLLIGGLVIFFVAPWPERLRDSVCKPRAVDSNY